MNYDRSITPLRPDHNALARAALTSVTRAAIMAGRNAGKRVAEASEWPEDRAVEWLLRSAVSPTKISDAAGLARLAVEFLRSLVPVSASAAVLDASISLSWDNLAQISIPGLTLPTAAWVGEGAPIPVIQGTSSTAATLTPSKLATAIVLSHEMVSGSNAEAIMRMVLVENIAATLDAALFGNAAAVPGTSPAGLLNGLSSLTPASAGAAAMVSDISALAQALGPVSGASQPILITNPRQAAVIKMTVFVDPFVVLPSNAIPDKTVIGIVPSAVVSVIGAPEITASIETTVHMASPASDIVSSPGTVAAPSRSVFQTDSLVLKFRMDAAWVRRATAGVQFVSATNW
jgi:hypothetical protein